MDSIPLEKDASLKDLARKYLAPAALAFHTLMSASPSQAATIDVNKVKQQIESVSTQGGQASVQAIVDHLKAAVKQLRLNHRKQRADLLAQKIKLLNHMGERPHLDQMREQIRNLEQSQNALQKATLPLLEWQHDQEYSSAYRADQESITKLIQELKAASQETDKTYKELLSIANNHLQNAEGTSLSELILPDGVHSVEDVLSDYLHRPGNK